MIKGDHKTYVLTEAKRGASNRNKVENVSVQNRYYYVHRQRPTMLKPYNFIKHFSPNRLKTRPIASQKRVDMELWLSVFEINSSHMGWHYRPSPSLSLALKNEKCYLLSYVLYSKGRQHRIVCCCKTFTSTLFLKFFTVVKWSHQIELWLKIHKYLSERIHFVKQKLKKYKGHRTNVET